MKAAVLREVKKPLSIEEVSHGKPGPREAGYYGAFVLDPDGNNIEAVARG